METVLARHGYRLIKTDQGAIDVRLFKHVFRVDEYADHRDIFKHDAIARQLPANHLVERDADRVHGLPKNR
ncbi:hypothetical protein [Massilia genomosp. 1]|uniref:hypothetical protein n=1 Tax=Massilia genomosp. 1 TaxID=2609280 RepID=UPI00141FE17D|nr:hypothetical protein [Massilia genomosp. 1]